MVLRWFSLLAWPTMSTYFSGFLPIMSNTHFPPNYLLELLIFFHLSTQQSRDNPCSARSSSLRPQILSALTFLRDEPANQIPAPSIQLNSLCNLGRDAITKPWCFIRSSSRNTSSHLSSCLLRQILLQSTIRPYRHFGSL